MSQPPSCKKPRGSVGCGTCRRCKLHLYYLKNKQRLLQKTNAYYKENKGIFKKLNADWYRRNKTSRIEKVKAWEAKNPDYVRAKNHRRRTYKLNSPGVPATKNEIQEVLWSTGGRCWYCGACVGDSITIDHVVPLARGGSGSRENLVPACKPCNSSKNATLVTDWLLSKPELEFNPCKKRYGLMTRVEG